METTMAYNDLMSAWADANNLPQEVNAAVSKAMMSYLAGDRSKEFTEAVRDLLAVVREYY